MALLYYRPVRAHSTMPNVQPKYQSCTNGIVVLPPSSRTLNNANCATTVSELDKWHWCITAQFVFLSAKGVSPMSVTPFLPIFLSVTGVGVGGGNPLIDKICKVIFELFPHATFAH